MSTLKHIRSSVANKRPAASGLADGQLGINTASGTPGLYFKDTASGIVKVGPAHVGSTAPNASPAGSAGNAIGEFWVDNSLTTQGLKYYTGATFYNLTPSGTTSAPGLVELATSAETQTGTDPDRAVTPSALQSKLSDSTSTTSSTTIASSTAVKSAYDLANAALPKSGGTVTGEIVIGTSGALSFEGSVDDGFETTLAVVNPTADRTITLPNTTGTVITTGDTGSVTSTMIADGTIVDGDINASASIALSKLATGALPSAITVNSSNIVDGSIVNADVSASAAIAGSKISPDFGNQTIQTTGIVSHAAGSAGAPTITFTGDTNTGVYSPGADQVAISTNGVGRLFVDSSGNVGIGTTPLVQLHLAGPARIGLNSTDDAELQIGAGATGDRNAYIDLVSDTTYTDYGLRLVRPNAGPNTSSYLLNRGTGTLYITAQDAGNVGFQTNNITRAFFSGAAFKLANSTDIRNDVNTDKITIFGGNGTGANIEMFGGSHAVEPSLMTLNAAEHRFRSQNGTSDRVRIDSSGRLLVGTSNSLTIAIQPYFQVHGTGENAYGSFGRWSADSNGPGLLFGKSRGGTVGVLGSVLPGDVLGEISFYGDNGTAFASSSQIIGYADGAVSGTSVPGRLVFTTRSSGAGGATERMRITNDGRVGIGTSAPSVPLEVNGSIYSKLSTSGDATLAAFNSVASFFILQRSDKAELYTGASQPIVFTNNNVERVRIDSSGRLLVGTSTYVQGNTYTTGNLLNVSGGSGVGPQLSTYSADAFALGIDFSKSRSASVGTGTIVQSGDALGNILFNGHDGTGYKQAATITAVVDGTPGTNSMPGRLVFSTTADGTSTPVERMRITNGGDVRIGTAAALDVGSGTDDGFRFLAPGTAAGIFQCSNNDAVGYFRRRSSDGIMLSFRRDTTQVGTISVTTTATAYNTSSDYRLKENVTAVTDGIARLQQLKPSRFNFIADPTKTVDGFLAHEVQSVIPEAITGEKDAVNDDGNPVYQGIDQSKLVPLVVAALQEAIAKIESLEARLIAAGI